MRRRTGQVGFGLIEILLVLVVVAVAGALLYRYFGATARTVEKIQEERPLARSKLAADQATLDSVHGLLRNYYAEHGRWPADKAAVLVLLQSPPRFQCAGNDFEYDPASGALRLLVADSARC
jgi:prepilin-type N-terminal cleavage/methylation domain-containing protein